MPETDEMAFQPDASETMSHGLDRAPLGRIASHEQDKELNFRPQTDQANQDELRGSSKLRRISKRLRRQLQRKPGHVVDMRTDLRTSDATIKTPVLAPVPSASTQNDRFSGKVPEKPSLPPLTEFVTKPIGTIKSIAHTKGGNEFAENLANTDISHGASVNLVLAHERIVALTNDQDRAMAVQDFGTLKKERQASFVGWTMNRHVRKVRAIQAQRVPWLDKKDFIRHDGGREEMCWVEYSRHLLSYCLQRYGGRYIGASSELPEPTESALVSSFERVILISAPIQNMLMKLMRIACWEIPMETAAYAMLYFFLCAFNFVIRAGIVFAIYETVKVRYYPPTISDLREKLERSEDTGRTAQDLVELIEQHGAHGWVGPLIEKAGPTMQLQLEDLANFLEIIQNFRGWRDPRRTSNTLVVLCFLWLVITVTPVWALVKVSFFAIGIVFFVITPISHRWPEYRLLVLPLTWLFWKIPTHGDWAIARLQAEAAQHLRSTPHATPSMNVNDFPDTREPFIGPIQDPRATQVIVPQRKGAQKDTIRVGRYHCTNQNLRGNLCLDTEGVYFEMHLTTSQKWRVEYAELKSVQKIVGSSTISSGEDILIIDMKDKQYQLSALKLRDEVFTQIIGYSGIDWQITG